MIINGKTALEIMRLDRLEKTAERLYKAEQQKPRPSLLRLNRARALWTETSRRLDAISMNRVFAYHD